jgi:hypothetical protein
MNAAQRMPVGVHTLIDEPVDFKNGYGISGEYFCISSTTKAIYLPLKDQAGAVAIEKILIVENSVASWLSP